MFEKLHCVIFRFHSISNDNKVSILTNVHINLLLLLKLKGINKLIPFPIQNIWDLRHAIAETLQINWEIKFRKLNGQLCVHTYLPYVIKSLVYNFSIFGFEEKFGKLYPTWSQGRKRSFLYYILKKYIVESAYHWF